MPSSSKRGPARTSPRGETMALPPRQTISGRCVRSSLSARWAGYIAFVTNWLQPSRSRLRDSDFHLAVVRLHAVRFLLARRICGCVSLTKESVMPPASEARSGCWRGDNDKRRPVAQTIYGEVGAIQREDAVQVQAFRDSDQRGVRKVHRQIGVLRHQFFHALQILIMGMFQQQIASQQHFPERLLSFYPDTILQQVHRFCNCRKCDIKSAIEFSQKGCALRVSIIVAVDDGDQRACVHQRVRHGGDVPFSCFARKISTKYSLCRCARSAGPSATPIMSS